MSPDVLRLLVADDEALARKVVRQYAATMAGVEIVSECCDTTQLEAELATPNADVALLDIRMPGRDLFSVLADASRRGSLPLLIFATAYDRYAVRAFELNAVDYLVKPFAAERLAEALARVRDRRQNAKPDGDVSSLLRDLGRRPDRLLVPDAGRIVPLQLSAISWIGAEGDYARLHAAGKTYLIHRTLTDLETRLDPIEFLRVHRSAIVRIDRIAEIHPADSGRYSLRMTDGTRLFVSRGRGAALKKLMV